MGASNSLQSLRHRLDHALLALADQDDDDGVLLRHDTRNILNIVGLLVDNDRVDDARVPEILSRGVVMIARIREYAEREGVYLPSGTESATRIMHTDDIRRALEEMRPGATEPPPELVPILVEAAEGPEPRHDTIPTPHPETPTGPTIEISGKGKNE